MERGATSAVYLGGLEEFQRFNQVAGQVLTLTHQFPGATLPLQLRQIFALLGVPAEVSSGLEEEIDGLAIGA